MVIVLWLEEELEVEELVAMKGVDVVGLGKLRLDDGEVEGEEVTLGTV